MRICFVTPEFVTEPVNFDGGLSNYLFRVSLSLIQLGHTPIVVVKSDRDEILDHHAIEVHRVKSHTRYSKHLSWIYQSYLLNERIRTIHQSKPFHIVQYTSYTATGLYRINVAPSVVRISSLHALIMSNYEIQKDESNEVLEKLEMYSIMKSDNVFGPSRLIAEEFNRTSNLKVEVIESPFLNDVIKHDNTLYQENLTGKKYLLFFGTIGLLKGVAILAEIMYELLAKHRDLFFVFVGKQYDFKTQTMMQYVSDKAGECRERVIRFDKLHHQQLYPIIEGAYAVVLPSRIDNFPNTCIEAMAHGKVVIGTTNTGFDQLIKDKFSGFLCERDNPKELLTVINKVLALPEEEKLEIEKNALKRIELLRPEIVVQQLIEYYKSVIHNFDKSKVLIKNEADMVVAKTYFQKIEILTSVVDEKESLVSQLKQMVDEKEVKVSALANNVIELKKIVAEKENTVKGLENTLEQKENNVIELKKIVAEKENTVKSLENTMEQKENNVIELKKIVAEKENTVKGLENTIERKENNVKELNKAVEEKENKVKTLENVINEKATKVKQLESIIGEKEKIITAKDIRIESIYESVTFKLGKVLLSPIVFVVNLFKK